MNHQLIAKGMAALIAVDPDIAAAHQQLGPPPPRSRPAGFETLLNTIISQQISTEVARVISARVASLLPSINATELARLEDQQLRDAGLSWRKVGYAKGLATAVLNKQLDVDGLALLDDSSAIESITQLRGFGRWSAEIYLMFSLGRPDVFPADDLALQVAVARLKGLEEKSTARQSRELVAHWAPWRSVGALFLWYYYRGAAG